MAKKISKTMSPSFKSRHRANKASKAFHKIYQRQLTGKGRKGKKYKW